MRSNGGHLEKSNMPLLIFVIERTNKIETKNWLSCDIYEQSRNIKDLQNHTRKKKNSYNFKFSV